MSIEKNSSHLECTLSDSDLFTPAFVQGDIEHRHTLLIRENIHSLESQSLHFNQLS